MLRATGKPVRVNLVRGSLSPPNFAEHKMCLQCRPVREYGRQENRCCKKILDHPWVKTQEDVQAKCGLFAELLVDVNRIRTS